MVQGIYEVIYYHVRLKEYIRKEEQVKQFRIQAQLDTLRNQSQPHFLFNTLNTLRDIIDQESKETTKKFVDQLSEIYRFILESKHQDLVSLSEELKFAKAYLHIQQERFGDNLQVVWQIAQSGNNHKIVPMSIQLLIENVIKHNIISKSKPLQIRIEMATEQLIVSNTLQPKSSIVPSTKKGLENICKRYQLIAKRLPSIKQTEDQFIVSLPLLT
ncbi:histidine kinase [Aquimarina sp. ERC-38]|uniref:sensor histidine kinase n=1 Tax=Aquimarina sp. ERC-38 TaxID=2949996 RepID=UPI0022471E4B|nr:histidine kinase [Aquimarina sp. ERC-38]UZO80504.1 histidine kinase [Aquimarina sp. ERC-38]